MSIGDSLLILRVWGPIIGPVLAILIFTFWRDHKREMRLQDRVEALEKDLKEILLPLVRQCSVVIAQNTIIMRRLEKMLQKAGSPEVADEKDLIDKLLEDAAAHRQDAE